MMSRSAETSTCAPFGTWKSPISADNLSSEDNELLEVAVSGDGKVYLVEGRPAENGRCRIVEFSAGKSRDVLPKDFSARTGVHEYGGGSFSVMPNGNLVFADWTTKGVFILDPATEVTTPIIDADVNVYYAQFNVHPTSSKWVLAVCEDHRSQEVVNSLVIIDASNRTVRTIASGADFYNHVQCNPAGDTICWTQWNHPDMPWTGTELYMADWRDGQIGSPAFVAGKPGVESIAQPRWSPDGNLFFCSDRTGYWQLYRTAGPLTGVRHINLEGLREGEFAGPEWWLGSCSYDFLTPDTIVALWTKDATTRVVTIDLKTSTSTIPPYPSLSGRSLLIRRATKTSFVVIGSTPSSPTALYHLDLLSPSHMPILTASTTISTPAPYFSTAQPLSFPRIYGPDRSNPSHAFFFPPQNPDFHPPTPSTPPPLILYMHGGPTTHLGPGLSLANQYWTTRGYALCLPNHAGSSGYGRAYRTRLNGHWGIADIADAASCVHYLVSAGRVDGTRVGIVGASAGGYACLEALCVYPELWAGGLSLYGISDVGALARETHKFEARYVEGLLFANEALSEGDRERIMRLRSPLFQAGRIRAAVLLLQGAEDRVVPPGQAEEMARVVREGGGRAELVLFEGEGHGFRKAENVRRCFLEQERWWRQTLVREMDDEEV